MRWLVRCPLHVVSIACVLLVALLARPAAAREAERVYTPEEPGSGAKLLAIDDRGDLLFVRPGAESNWIEAIDSDHGKVKGRYEGLAPATCAYVDPGGNWLLAGDAQGRVMRWRLKDGVRDQVLEIKDDAGAPRPVSAIVAGRHGVFVFSRGLLGELTQAVFSQHFDAQQHARVVFRKEGHTIECVDERKGLVVTSNGGNLYGFDPSKEEALWTRELGYAPTTVVDVPGVHYVLEAKDTLRLIEDRKGEVYEERDCEGVTCAVVLEDAETIYVGMHGGSVDRYVEDKEGGTHGLSPADRERQKHDRNSIIFRPSERWGGFASAVTAILVEPRGNELFASDSKGNLYKIWIGDDHNDGNIGPIH